MLMERKFVDVFYKKLQCGAFSPVWQGAVWYGDTMCGWGVRYRHKIKDWMWSMWYAECGVAECDVPVPGIFHFFSGIGKNGTGKSLGTGIG